MESHEMSWFFSPEIYVSGLFAFAPVGFVLVNTDVHLVGLADLGEDLSCGDLAAEGGLNHDFDALLGAGSSCSRLLLSAVFPAQYEG